MPKLVSRAAESRSRGPSYTASVETGPDWGKVLEVYEAIDDIPAAQRESFLASLSYGPEIRNEVLALLERAEPEAPEPQTPESPLFEQFGKYRLIRKLGHGGSGEVYAALDTELERTVALKFLSYDALTGRSKASRLKREARTLSAMNHPNIVTVHEIIEADSHVAIVMELVAGDTLHAFTYEPFATERLIRIGEQIAQALAAAHAVNIVHSDIKPENIILRADGYIKLLDFGLARKLDARQSTTGNLTAGTLRYMSPEQAHFEPLTGATDIFSTALILYELATGMHPFDAESPFEVLHAITTRDPKPPTSMNHALPRRLSDLIMTMLAKDPKQRPNAVHVAETLAAIRADLTPAPSAAQNGHRKPVWIATVTLAIAAVLAGWTLIGIRRQPEPIHEFRFHPLTSQIGWEGSPALSPDGNSVAFTWTERLDEPRQIYVKQVNDERIVKLTSLDVEGTVGGLAWCPDGKRLAYRRWYGEYGAIYTIASSGGDETKIIDVNTSDSSSSIDWSPDGTQLAYSDALPGTKGPLSIYLLNLQTGEKRRLTAPVQVWGDWDPRFSPDGRTIAFKRVSGYWLDDVYVVPVTGGLAKRVTNERRGIWGHAWTSDGTALILSCQRGGTIFGLWRYPLNSPERPERIVDGGMDAIMPSTGRHTNRITWVNQKEDVNIYRVATSGAGVPAKFIASTLRDIDPAYAPNGRIAFVSDRSGSREIWIANANGLEQRRISNAEGAAVRDLAWSPDGRQLAFSAQVHGNADVYVTPCQESATKCGEPRRITSDPAVDFSPTWSADGRLLYFASGRGDEDNIWQEPVEGGPAVRITSGGGFLARESTDGRWLYYTRWGGERIWRLPGSRAERRDGNEKPEVVIGSPFRVQSGGWTVTPTEIYFVDSAANRRSATIRAWNQTTGKTRSILELGEVFTDRGDISLTVSPDGRWLLYTQMDRSGSNVMIADAAH